VAGVGGKRCQTVVSDRPVQAIGELAQEGLRGKGHVAPVGDEDGLVPDHFHLPVPAATAPVEAGHRERGVGFAEEPDKRELDYQDHEDGREQEPGNGRGGCNSRRCIVGPGHSGLRG
jgi:hypothetical protein